MNGLYRLANNFLEFSHQIFGFNRLSPIFVINYEKHMNCIRNDNQKSLIEDVMSNGILLAVQKKRRTVEKKLRRRFGVEAFPQDTHMIRPKTNIIVCDNCGDYHELHTICGNCYKRVKEESNLIIETMRQKFSYSQPIEEEVNIRYKDDNPDETEHKRGIILEMDRKRPDWFAKTLLTKSVSNKWIEKNPIIRDSEPKVIKDN